MSFKNYLFETFNNIFKEEDKQKYIEIVWDILVESYKPVGGLTKVYDKKDLMSIPFWKVIKRDGNVTGVILYKDKNGRKLVAMGTDGSKEAKKQLKFTLNKEFERSLMEVSGPLLKYLERNWPDLVKKYTIPVEKVQDILGTDVEPTTGNFYKRMIGKHNHEKILIGTPGKKFY